MRASSRLARRLGALCLGLAMAAAGAQPSQDEGWPTRVGRVADLQGTLWAYDVDEGGWVSAWRNRPVVEGDLFSVSDDGRADLRIGTTVLRLDGGTQIAVVALDDARMVFELQQGALAWRVRSEAHARQSELRLREGSVRPLAPGHFHVDRAPGEAGPAHAAAWRGRLEIAGGGNLIHLDPGERVQIRTDDRRGVVTTRPARMPDDAFAEWALAADTREGSVEAYRHVAPDLTGAEDLDRYGRWESHPEHGTVWVPYDVAPDWEPFRDGRWVWLRPWGWTWADAAPWGFAPFHYGRWVRWGLRWVWWPGQRHAVAVFQPALVAWVGGPHLSFGITIGSGVRPPPPVGWVPLAPYEPYVPRYRPPRHGVHPPHWVAPPPRQHVRPPRYVEPVPPPRTRRGSPPPAWRDGDRPPRHDAPHARDEDGSDRPQRAEPSRPEAPSARPPVPEAPPRGGPGRGEPRRDGPGRDGPGRDGPGRDGPGRDGPGRDEPRRGGPERTDGERGAMPPPSPRAAPQLPARPSLPAPARERDGARPDGGARSARPAPVFGARDGPATVTRRADGPAAVRPERVDRVLTTEARAVGAPPAARPGAATDDTTDRRRSPARPAFTSVR